MSTSSQNMGLLSNTENRNKMAKLIIRYGNKLCLLCYIVGLIWFLGLAYVQLNANTYFSENALLPGLVDSDFQHGHGSADYFQELKALVKSRKSDSDSQMLSEWLHKKFSELRLDVYAHNYSFKYPFDMSEGQTLMGQNTYAILRAPRAPGTEAIVLSAPYNQGNDKTLAGIALMLGLAKAFKRHSYWAKDIIFLVTDNKEIGMQAWLSAYYHSYNQFIAPGELLGRSGSIQAAVNLDIGTDIVHRMNVHVEGLNGQLPNLDLVNTAIRLCRREGIVPTLHNDADYWNNESWNGFEHALKTMLKMMWQQASGMPSGNHGLFHRYNVEAVTLRGTKLKNSKQSLGFAEMGRVIEGICRSLNNLLERFHQSFFFYLLPSTDRYVSIGLYMPPFGLIALPLAVKAIALWLNSRKMCHSEVGVKQNSDAVDDKRTEEMKTNKEPDDNLDVSSVNNIEADSTQAESRQSLLQLLCYLPCFFVAQCFGIVAFYSPGYLIQTSTLWNLAPGTALAIGSLALQIAIFCFPFLFNWKQSKNCDALDARVLKCVSLLAFGIMLAATAVVNISLAFFVAVIWVPVAVFVQPTNNRIRQLIQYICLMAISPLGLACIAAAVNQYLKKSAPWNLQDFVTYAWEDVENSLLMSVVQSKVFGSVTYGLATLCLFPVWILFRLIPSCDIPV